MQELRLFPLIFTVFFLAGVLQGTADSGGLKAKAVAARVPSRGILDYLFSPSTSRFQQFAQGSVIDQNCVLQRVMVFVLIGEKMHFGSSTQCEGEIGTHGSKIEGLI